MSDEIQVTVKGLVPSPTGCGVLLGNDELEKVIAIFVDHSVAAAITMFLHGIKKPRPLTHDLMVNILLGLGVTVDRVLISDLAEDTFFARIFLTQENELGRNVIEVDARPSDSMALAIRQQAPIYIARAVWDRADDASWAIEEADNDTES